MAFGPLINATDSQEEEPHGSYIRQQHEAGEGSDGDSAAPPSRRSSRRAGSLLSSQAGKLQPKTRTRRGGCERSRGPGRGLPRPPAFLHAGRLELGPGVERKRSQDQQAPAHTRVSGRQPQQFQKGNEAMGFGSR